MMRGLPLPLDPLMSSASALRVLAPLALLALLSSTTAAQSWLLEDDFRQLEEILPTPNAARAASGAPGHGYWQQQADYVIDVEIDEGERRLTGSETITYTNNSPDTLRYLWVQLDQNLFAPGSDGQLIETAPDFGRFSFGQLRTLLAKESFEGGMTIHRVADGNGRALEHTIVGTMMRIDLPVPLAPETSTVFAIDWDYLVNDAKVIRARSGYEHFPADGNDLFEMAQWFPRMAAYTDVNGWQHKQFLGRGEFTLEFGDYLVRITMPDDHIVASTGVLQNPDEVLTSTQRERLEQSVGSNVPVFIVTPDEAEANESSTPSGRKTWVYAAENVRDFAWASSRKFAWDAMGHDVGGKTVMAMSYYPKEGEPMWSRYSTHAVAHTLDIYSKYTFDYPYPVAISVNGPIGGMEYPMICFNGPRPEEDGTYSKRTKYGLIGVIIHEVGHNWFPMIVNSDERQWTWMDEGLNTFVQYLTEAEWEDEYPSRRGEPRDITGFMSSTNQVPIMTNSESLLQFGANAYAKPATALNVLRETVLGRDVFDMAFREYSQRWMFKRPQPADLFRSIEDASGVDLDWFWRGWFYTTDHVDLALTGMRHYVMETGDPDVDKAAEREERDSRPVTKSAERNAPLAKRIHAFPELLDFYNEYDELDVTDSDRKSYEKFLAGLDDWERDLLDTERHFYAIDVENLGGLVMPVLIEITYENGDVEELRIPAEIWKRNDERVTKLLMVEQPIASITLDPQQETADVDTSNNVWPPASEVSRFKLYKSKKSKNPMQKARSAEGEESGENDDDASSDG